jgi:hypothetical protein
MKRRRSFDLGAGAAWVKLGPPDYSIGRENPICPRSWFGGMASDEKRQGDGDAENGRTPNFANISELDTTCPFSNHEWRWLACIRERVQRWATTKHLRVSPALKLAGTMYNRNSTQHSRHSAASRDERVMEMGFFVWYGIDLWI